MKFALLFALNLVVDYFLLLLTAKLFCRRPSFWRLGAGAFLGSLAVLLYLPPLVRLPLLPAIPITAAVMVMVTFRPLAWLEAAMLLGGLFLVSFMLAGFVLALFSTGIVNPAVYPWALCALCASCLLLYLLFGVLRPYLEERKKQTLWHVELSINWRGKEKMIHAFTDTGNRLRDPCSQYPVIITYYRSLEGLLPDIVFRHFASSDADPWAPLQEFEDYSLVRSFTLVPYRGVNNGEGMLLGFKPDAVTAVKGNHRRPLGNRVVLGLIRHDFGPLAGYQALVPPELVEAEKTVKRGCLHEKAVVKLAD